MPKYTYRCTGVTHHGETDITELTGYEAEYLADGWMGRCIGGSRYVYARITVVDDKGNIADVRREHYIGKGAR